MASKYAFLALGKLAPGQYGSTRAAYDLKKFRGQEIVQRIANTRRYQASREGLIKVRARDLA